MDDYGKIINQVLTTLLKFLQDNQWAADTLLLPISIFVVNFCKRFKQMIDDVEDIKRDLKELLYRRK